MNEVYIGVALLLGIVVVQYISGRVKRNRMLTSWTKAEDALREGRLNDAERLLQKCVSIAPLWVHGAVALSMVQGQLGKSNEAEEGLLRARELHPKEAEPEYGLGMLYATLLEGREEEAVIAFRSAIEKNSEFESVIAKDPRLESLRSHPSFPKLEEVTGTAKG